ncbi:GNAT family N-acetyltransferase [Paenibacillus sp. YAF4_2]|uniref:GNAT family N-acetyltransferase n=1 Tax=Paenibacillus sp. YAF4_2 TaxID=3233085 RepID=UPI003F9A2B9C
MEITIRNIHDTELNTFVEVLTEGARWIAKNNVPMWDEADLTLDQLLHSLTIDNVYAAIIGGEFAAVMILQEEDSFFWPEDLSNDSLYLHKLCIRRKYAKSGLSSSMLEFAKNRAHDLHKSYLKLDCASDRPSLRQLYEQHGFQLVREAQVMEKYSAAFYQYKVKSYAEA